MKKYRLLFILMGVLSLFTIPTSAQNAESLLKKMDALISAPQDKEAKVKIVTIDKTGNEKIKEASLKQKGRYKKIFKYTKPENQSGIATLILEGDKTWLYMPAFAKPMKISILSKSQAFNGTDFSREDRSGTPYLDRYIPKLLQTTESNIYLMELSPRSKKSSYSKIILHLNKEFNYPVKMEYFKNKDKLDKIATYTYVKENGYWFAQKVLMLDVQKKHSTEITMIDVKFDQGLSDDEFAVDALMK